MLHFGKETKISMIFKNVRIFVFLYQRIEPNYFSYSIKYIPSLMIFLCLTFKKPFSFGLFYQNKNNVTKTFIYLEYWYKFQEFVVPVNIKERENVLHDNVHHYVPHYFQITDINIEKETNVSEFKLKLK